MCNPVTKGKEEEENKHKHKHKDSRKSVLVDKRRPEKKVGLAEGGTGDRSAVDEKERDAALANGAGGRAHG